MIIGGSKKEVVANIKNAADNGRFNDKVEIGDPELDSTRRKKLLGKYVKYDPVCGNQISAVFNF